MTNEALSAELLRIGKGHGGFVRPSDVVREASSSRSALHGFFEWDDAVAAAEYRLEQARYLIRRVSVTVMHGDEPVSIRAFVSLRSDRGDGSYRQTVTVLSMRETRGQALAEALAEMEAFTAKYRHLVEIAEVVQLMDRTSRRLRPRAANAEVARA